MTGKQRYRLAVESQRTSVDGEDVENEGKLA